MLKIQMTRCYPHIDNSSVLNGIITDVESHYNKMVEVVSKLECRITNVESCLTDSVKNLDWVVKEKRLDDDFGKEMRKQREEYDQKLVLAIEDLDIPKQKELQEQIAHHRRIEDFYKQIAELKEENKKLREENDKLKQSQTHISNEELNSRLDCLIAQMNRWDVKGGAK